MKHIHLFENFKINEAEEIPVRSFYAKTAQPSAWLNFTDEDIEEFKQAMEEFRQMGCDFLDHKATRLKTKEIYTVFKLPTSNGQERDRFRRRHIELHLVKTQEGYLFNLAERHNGYKCDSMTDVIDFLRNKIEE